MEWRQAPCHVGGERTGASAGRVFRFGAMNLARLRVFHEVARTGTFTAAAEALSYTPSAVSQQMAKLEAELATALVVRTSRGVTLTDAGVALLQRTRSILGEV